MSALKKYKDRCAQLESEVERLKRVEGGYKFLLALHLATGKDEVQRIINRSRHFLPESDVEKIEKRDPGDLRKILIELGMIKPCPIEDREGMVTIDLVDQSK